jgi:hypothetical protein
MRLLPSRWFWRCSSRIHPGSCAADDPDLLLAGPRQAVQRPTIAPSGHLVRVDAKGKRAPATTSPSRPTGFPACCAF